MAGRLFRRWVNRLTFSEARVTLWDAYEIHSLPDGEVSWYYLSVGPSSRFECLEYILHFDQERDFTESESRERAKLF